MNRDARYLNRLVSTTAAGLMLAGCMVGSAKRPQFPDKSPQDEEIVDVPVSPTTTGESATEMEVLAVSVQPARIPRGQETSLVLSYRVGGIAAGQSVEVVERRELLKDGESIRNWEDRIPAPPGHTLRPSRSGCRAAPHQGSTPSR